MRIYFFSEGRAWLKLDGEYAGITDGYPRFAEFGSAFAEWLPFSGEAVHFYIDDAFFFAPHEDVCAARAGEERFLLLRPRKKCAGQGVEAQLRAGGTLYSLLRFGGTYLACDGPDCALIRLKNSYTGADMHELTLRGEHLLLLRGEGTLAVARGTELLYEGAADGFDEAGGKVTVYLRDCEDSVLTFDILHPQERSVAARCAALPAVRHIALFERVLHGADCSDCLCESLKGRAGELKGYLGDFCAVVPPTESARKKYGDAAAGLVYRLEEGLYDIKWFRAELEDGLVSNIFPAE